MAHPGFGAGGGGRSASSAEEQRRWASNTDVGKVRSGQAVWLVATGSVPSALHVKSSSVRARLDRRTNDTESHGYLIQVGTDAAQAAGAQRRAKASRTAIPHRDTVPWLLPGQQGATGC